MKLLTYLSLKENDQSPRPGLLTGTGQVLDLTSCFPTMRTLLEQDTDLKLVRSAAALANEGSSRPGRLTPLEECRLLPPVPDARKLLALAGNYAEHVREGGRESHPKSETYPYFFLKPASTGLTGSGSPILRPAIARQLDYEGELAVIIGRRGRDIAESEAMSYVAGYTCFNDISERALASHDGPRAPRDRDRHFDWLVGKWYDSGAPCGPWLVTRDELPDPHRLMLSTRLNGDLVQHASTSEMIFTIPELIAWISRFMTLEPGDLIATGTPAGVGKARGRLLQPGDLVEVEIEGIGLLSNPVEEMDPAR